MGKHCCSNFNVFYVENEGFVLYFFLNRPVSVKSRTDHQREVCFVHNYLETPSIVFIVQTISEILSVVDWCSSCSGHQ